MPASNPCKACRNGTCSNRASDTCQGTLCKECRDGTCSNKTNDTTCNGMGKCLNGTCNAQPTCKQFNAPCIVGTPPFCCSGNCDNLVPGNVHCAKGAAGTMCLASTNCTSGSCIGYTCA